MHNFRLLVVIFLASASSASRELRGNAYYGSDPRGERSLTNTFPFNQDGGHHGHHHDDHHQKIMHYSDSDTYSW